jgi:putative sterol carrier protein
MERIDSVQQYFETLGDRFVPEAARGVEANILYEIGGDGGSTWTVTVSDQSLTVQEGTCDQPKVTIMMDAEEYVQMVNGDLDGTRAYMTRKLKVKGSIPMAQKMKKFLPARKKD